METRQKVVVGTAAVLAYLLAYSTRLPIFEYEIYGANLANDFSRVFIFASDIAALIALVIFFICIDLKTSILKKILLFLLLFVGWAAIGLFTVPATYIGAAALIRLAIAAGLFYTLSKLPSSLTHTYISLGIIISGLVQTIIAASQFIAQKSSALPMLGISDLHIGNAGVATFTAGADKILRAYGTFPHPNMLAFYLLIALLFAASMAHMFKAKPKQRIIIIGTILSIGLLLTFSRIFIALALIAVPAVWYILKPVSKKRNIQALSIAALVFIVFFSIISLRPVGGDESLNLRMIYDAGNNHLIQQNPTTGTGIGQAVLKGNDSLHAALKEEGVQYQPWMHQPVHNSYGLILAETGWPGLLLFVLFLIYLTNGIFSKLKSDPGARSDAYFVFSSIATLAIIAAMFFDHMFLTNPNLLYLMFIMFALLANTKTTTKNYSA